jgi:magnesium chelatase family protein
MWVEVREVKYSALSDTKHKGEESQSVRKRILAARERQHSRFKEAVVPYHTNSEMGARDIEKLIVLGGPEREALNASAAHHGLSGRAYHRVIKLARTIADLDGSEAVTKDHLMEAVSYRPKQMQNT